MVLVFENQKYNLAYFRYPEICIIGLLVLRKNI